MITISLPIPDRKLSLNGREHWRTVRKGQQAQHEVAGIVGKVAVMHLRLAPPAYPTELVSVFIDVERKKRGNVWDTPGIIEACKGYCDGLQGSVYTNDSQIRGFMLRWDAKPTGNGLIHLYIRALSEPQDWPVVAWATEEWR